MKNGGDDSGMESSGHSLIEAELLQGRNDALILDENDMDGSEIIDNMEECDTIEHGSESLEKGEKSSEGEAEGFKQLYLRQKKLLQGTQYRLKESNLKIVSLQKRLDEEVILGGKLREKCDALLNSLAEEALHRAEAESLLEEERGKSRKIQKQFDREWAEFEKRLIEERAMRSDIERQSKGFMKQFEEEKSCKMALQRELEALKERLNYQEKHGQYKEGPQDSVIYEETCESEAHTDLESSDWIISRDEIEVSNGKSLGTGGWGVVREGKFRGCRVAVKQIHELILSPHNRRLFMREMEIASRCRHPCLLQFVGATNDDGIPLFVTELMDTSLRDLLEKQPLNKVNIVTIALDVARALNYLHLNKPPIIHRDVSSGNVLLWRRDNQWRAKVCDYGTANFMRHCRTINPGAIVYSAPEALSLEQSPKV